MCGIAGIFAIDGPPPERATVAAMTRALAHRGPDGEGLWLDGVVGFGHRRLSIIDLAGGAQPMRSLSGRFTITYNGEIYNYRELRAELVARGRRFRTASDTEVILELVEERGIDALSALSGMYALALWDAAERCLHLARDHLGIKPLFVAREGGRLLFASEINGLRAGLGTDPELDRGAVNAYFHRQYIAGPQTIFAGIESVPPATVVTVATAGERRTGLFRLDPGRRLELDEDDAARAVAEQLDRAVRRHLVSDVPVGVFLSGGIDSSALLGVAADHASGPLKTFSVGFGEPRIDELAFARLAAERHGSEHHTLTVSAAEGLRALPAIVRGLGQPLADYAIVPTYVMSRFAAREVKVVLGGEGADELFGGYRRYHRYALLDRAAALLGLAGRLPVPSLPAPLFADRARRALLRDAFVAGAELASEGRLRTTLDDHRSAGAVNAALHADLTGWLVDDLLVKVDRMGMLASLEARVPYLDPALVELVMALPGRLKVGVRGTKRVLRTVVAGHVPATIRERPKQGFTVPVEDWLRGPLRRRFEEIALERDDDWLSRRSVEALWRQLGAGRRVGLELWSILIFRWWCDEHLRRP